MSGKNLFLTANNNPMKHHYTTHASRKTFVSSLLLLFAFVLTSNAQHHPPDTQHFADLHPDSVIRMNPQHAQMLFEPGEVIVRFRDEVEVSLSDKNGAAQIGLSSVDAILEAHQVVEAGKLIPGAERLHIKEILTAPTGRQFERPSLHNIYLLRTEAEPYELFPLIQTLRDDPDVLYAEPNYLYAAIGAEPLSPELSEEEMLAWLDKHSDFMESERGQSREGKREDVYEPNDPLYVEQWGFAETQVNQVWTTTTGSSDAVIAILDTGVDYNHPDLASNIWSNPGETVNGSDSDGNGFVDDIRGWDFINQNNSPMDDNSHGTHVAGIAAAVGDNGMGIAGVNWHAQIMPVKVLQSSGFGTVATIVQGINYAAENGATVINMSFGSYARSLAMEDALANAYATAVLVAAAGNDGLCIGPGLCPDMRPGRPMYPGGISYVLGIEALAGFSNYDQDGPVFSAYPELYNYELPAPGAGMISTIPNGGYRVYSGTSMAAPFTAGAISLYREFHPEQSQEMLWGNFINTRSEYIQLKDAIEVEPLPVLSIISRELVDTLNGDGDSHPDVGETIELWLTVRNTWGQADNVQAKLQLGEFEDPTVANITHNQATIGSISAYATRTNESDPFVIEIADDLVHGRHIVFEALVWEEGMTDTISQGFYLEVINATKVWGLITDSVTWTPNNRYLLVENLRIAEEGVLTILPGTEVVFRPNKSIDVRGKLCAKGKAGERISFSGDGQHDHIWDNRSGLLISESGLAIIDFCKFTGLNKVLNIYGTFNYDTLITITNSLFQNNYFWEDFLARTTFSNNLIDVNIYGWTIFKVKVPYTTLLKHNVITNNESIISINSPIMLDNFSDQVALINHNSFINNVDNNLINFNIEIRGNSSYEDITNNYWGTKDSLKIQESIIDFYINSNAPIAIFSPYLEAPSEEAPGHVWKVLVNGADAQDEFVEPVGIGQHEFKVYFNRAMDPDYPPQITFGVRAPYTQQAVAEDGQWSDDYKVYTAYATVGLLTGDGINRVRVYGARDPNGFEIPVEDSRFEFLIDAAAGASTAFSATPGMGRIELNWDAFDEIEDVLGYNLYRFEMETDTTFTEPALLNQQLVLDTEYTDFEVLPGDAYFYYYKILRTNMVETDSSQVVTAIPHTADPGDANGDYEVDVMDIVTIVAYMLNQNPQPFIFEAADVNQDGVVNVMDIVGVVDLIMNAKSEFFPNPAMHPDPAYVHFKDDIVQIESDGQLAAIEFTLLTAFPDQVQLTSLLPGFELAWQKTADGIHGFIFNMQNKCIPEGITNIIRIQHQNPDLHWGKIFGADPDGQIVEILTEPVGISEQQYLPDELHLDIFPNPARELLNIEYSLPMAADVEVVFLDILGQRVGSLSFPAQQPGLNTHAISIRSHNLPEGIVFCRVTARGHQGGLLQKTVKVVVQ
jgi:subtilisin family serine protease